MGCRELKAPCFLFVTHPRILYTSSEEVKDLRYVKLGSTPFEVSQLCFGALTIGPLQRDMDTEAGGEVLLEALDQGVTFIDTAQMYRTYDHIAWALSRSTSVPLIVSKSYACTGEDMETAVVEARRKLGDHVPLFFLLHEQESEHTIRGHWPAVEYLQKAKDHGHVQGIGVSTHHVRCVQAAATVDVFDVISPLVNLRGIGIQGGELADMSNAIGVARRNGKGIYAMKPLGGGHLLSERRRALEYLRQLPTIDAVAVGMKSVTEVHYNVALFSDQEPDESTTRPVRQLHIDDWCTGCGACERACGQGAVVVRDGQAVCDQGKCVFCGYCGTACPEFAIKVI